MLYLPDKTSWETPNPHLTTGPGRLCRTLAAMGATELEEQEPPKMLSLVRPGCPQIVEACPIVRRRVQKFSIESAVDTVLEFDSI